MSWTGWTNPTATAWYDAGASGAITNPSNVEAQDDTPAYSLEIGKNEATDRYLVSSFGFSVPSTATILAVSVRFDAYFAGASVVTNFSVDARPSVAQGITEEQGSFYIVDEPSDLVDDDTYHTITPVEAPLWGATLTPAIVNASEFGFLYAFQNFDADDTADMYCDEFQANVEWTYLLEPTVGTFTLTGNAATLKHSKLSADTGAFIQTGNAATFKYSSMPADVGAFSLTGIAAAFKTFQLPADSGSFVLTGGEASIRGPLRVSDYVLTGYPAGFVVDHPMGADAATFALTGNVAALYDTGVEPIAFSGFVATQISERSTAFSLDVSSLFTGDSTPFTYAIASGTLPTNLSIDPNTGIISGTPTVHGRGNIVVEATDAVGGTAYSNVFEITITSDGLWAETIPSSGTHGSALLYPVVDIPTDTGVYVTYYMKDEPDSGTFAYYDDSSFSFSGADGVYSTTIDIYFDGVFETSTTHIFELGEDGCINDHGQQLGLDADDHPQYLNNYRGDARYYNKEEIDYTLDNVAAGVTGDLQINNAGALGTIDGLTLDTSGNARGTGALDIQSIRTTATQVASGNGAVAIGKTNIASGGSAFAFGFGCQAIGESSVACGGLSVSSGIGSVAVGALVHAAADSSYVFGGGIINNTVDSAEIGPNNTAKISINSSGNLTVRGEIDVSTNKIVGVVDPTADQDAATKKYVDDNVATPAGVTGDLQINNAGALGTIDGLTLDTSGDARGANALDIQSFRADPAQVASGAASVAVGISAKASGATSYAMGSGTSAEGDFSTALGVLARAASPNSVAVGYYTWATATGAVALGGNITNSTPSSVEIGFSDTYKLSVDGSGNLTVRGAISASTNKITDVVDPTADQDAATKKYVDDNFSPAGVTGDLQINNAGALGTIDGLTLDTSGNARGISSLDIQSYRAVATDVADGDYSTAIGYSVEASGSSAVAIGKNNKAGEFNSIAIGVDNESLVLSGVAIGLGCDALGTNGVAVGRAISNSTANSAEFGPNNTAKISIDTSGNLTVRGDVNLPVGGEIRTEQIVGQDGTDPVFVGHQSAVGWQHTAFGSAILNAWNNDTSGFIDGLIQANTLYAATQSTTGVFDWRFIDASTTPYFYLQQHSTNATGADFKFYKGRTTLIGPTVVVADDVLGRVSFNGYDGTVYDEAASIEATANVSGAVVTADLTYTADEHIFSGLLASAKRPTLHVGKTSSAIQDCKGVAGTQTFISWDTQDNIDTAHFTHSTSTNNSRLTVDNTGRYQIICTVGMDTASTNRTTYMLRLRTNGTTDILRGTGRAYNRGTAFGDLATMNLITELELTAADYIEAFVEIGSTSDAGAAAQNTIWEECEIILRRLD